MMNTEGQCKGPCACLNHQADHRKQSSLLRSVGSQVASRPPSSSPNMSTTLPMVVAATLRRWSTVFRFSDGHICSPSTLAIL